MLRSALSGEKGISLPFDLASQKPGTEIGAESDDQREERPCLKISQLRLGCQIRTRQQATMKDTKMMMTMGAVKLCTLLQSFCLGTKCAMVMIIKLSCLSRNNDDADVII